MKGLDISSIKEAQGKLTAAFAIIPDDTEIWAVELGHRIDDETSEFISTVSIHSMKPVNLPGYSAELVSVSDSHVHAHLHIDEDTEIWWAVRDD